MASKQKTFHLLLRIKNDNPLDIYYKTRKNYSYRSTSKNSNHPSSFQQTSLPFDFPKSTIPINGPQNFVRKNKNNLFNFKKDRISKQNLMIYQQKNKKISRSKLIQIKREEQERKMNTRITLKDSNDFEQFPNTLSSIEVENKFSLPTKSKSRKKNSVMPEMSKIRTTQMHKKATESTLLKQSQTPKQKLFTEVFGDGIRLKTRKRKNTQREEQIIKVHKQNTKMRLKLRSLEKKNTDKAEFRALLEKITQYSEQFSRSFRKRSQEDLEKKEKTVSFQENPEIQDKEIQEKIISTISEGMLGIGFIEANAKNIRYQNRIKTLHDDFYRQLKEENEITLSSRYETFPYSFNLATDESEDVYREGQSFKSEHYMHKNMEFCTIQGR